VLGPMFVKRRHAVDGGEPNSIPHVRHRSLTLTGVHLKGVKIGSHQRRTEFE